MTLCIVKQQKKKLESFSDRVEYVQQGDETVVRIYNQDHTLANMMRIKLDCLGVTSGFTQPRPFDDFITFYIKPHPNTSLESVLDDVSRKLVQDIDSLETMVTKALQGQQKNKKKKNSMLPVWFLVLFIIIVVMVIAALSVLFYFVFKEDDSQSQTTGPQGLPGKQGELGFTGLRGVQGFAMIGPQGTAGSQSTASSQTQSSVFFFQSFDNATFLVVPDQKSFLTRKQTIDHSVTIDGSLIVCNLNKSNATSFTLRLQVNDSIPNQDSIVAFGGYAQLATTNVPVLLTSVLQIDSANLALVFQSNGILWNGSGTSPPCTCFFTVTYQTSS